MRVLTVESDYLSIDVQDWLEDVASWDDILSTQFQDAAQSIVDAGELGGSDYATTENVLYVLRDLGYTDFSGLYGEDDPMHVSTCNEESFLAHDVSFLYVTAKKDGWVDTFIVMTGQDYWQDKIQFCQVYMVDDMDVTAPLSYGNGYAAHVDQPKGKHWSEKHQRVVEYKDGCPMDWIIESAFTLWPNGGTTPAFGELPRVWDVIVEDDEKASGYKMECPHCGGELEPVTN